MKTSYPFASYKKNNHDSEKHFKRKYFKNDYFKTNEITFKIGELQFMLHAKNRLVIKSF